jgi:hypothetical protein
MLRQILRRFAFQAVNAPSRKQRLAVRMRTKTSLPQRGLFP